MSFLQIRRSRVRVSQSCLLIGGRKWPPLHNAQACVSAMKMVSRCCYLMADGTQTKLSNDQSLLRCVMESRDRFVEKHVREVGLSELHLLPFSVS